MSKFLITLLLVFLSSSSVYGDDKADLENALILIKSNKSEEALPALYTLANKDESRAQIALGYYFIQEKQNESEALAWLRKAAKSGTAEAQLHLGLVLTEIIKRPVHYEEGIRWLIIAANNNNRVAANQLSSYYHRGDKGLKKNFKKSEYWRLRALHE